MILLDELAEVWRCTTAWVEEYYAPVTVKGGTEWKTTVHGDIYFLGPPSNVSDAATDLCPRLKAIKRGDVVSRVYWVQDNLRSSTEEIAPGNEKAGPAFHPTRRRVFCCVDCGGRFMSEQKTSGDTVVSRDRLAELLNEDLAREYQAIIAYVVYSQVLKGAEFMSIATQLETHAQEELKHALIISRQIDYLGKMPVVTPKLVRTSEDAREMLRFDLDNENETIRNYRQRVRQCEALNEFAMAEQIRQILIDEQDHQIDLATALGEDPPDLTSRKGSKSS